MGLGEVGQSTSPRYDERAYALKRLSQHRADVNGWEIISRRGDHSRSTNSRKWQKPHERQDKKATDIVIKAYVYIGCQF